MTSPRGITAARPPFCHLRFGVRTLGFIDVGDFGDLKCLGLVLGGSQGRLVAFCSLLGRSWRPLGASWGALGGVLGPLERILGASWCLLGASEADLEETKTSQR